MKIKLDQLKKIIREELAGELSESEAGNASTEASGDEEEAKTGAETVYDGSTGTTGMGKISENEGSSDLAEAIAALEAMHQNLEGIIARLKEDPNAPLGTDVAMAHWGLDD